MTITVYNSGKPEVRLPSVNSCVNTPGQHELGCQEQLMEILAPLPHNHLVRRRTGHLAPGSTEEGQRRPHLHLHLSCWVAVLLPLSMRVGCGRKVCV